MNWKSACTLLLCLAPLTILPGCLHSSPFGNTVVEGPKKIYDHSSAKLTETQEPKLVSDTLVKQPVAINDREDLPKNTANGAKIDPIRLTADLPRPDAPAGLDDTNIVVTSENGPPPIGGKTTGFQILPTLPPLVENQRKYAPLTEALQLLIDGRHQDALQHLRTYDEETQEFLLRLLPVLIIVEKKSVSKMSDQEIENLNDLLIRIIVNLRPRTELAISKMCYCKRIRGYAEFDALPDNTSFLTPSDRGPGDQVQLYVELKNFASELMKDKEYLTKLACSLELRDDKGKKVWSYAFDRNDTTYRRSARMNDYHGNYSFYVPQLPSGTYQLTIQIVDETIPDRRRVARKSLDFRVTPIANQPALR